MKLFFAIAAAAISSAVAEKEFCGETNLTHTDAYILYNNLWGAWDDPKGWQCTGIDSVDSSNVAWHTNFNWSGTPWQAKSYANTALKFEPVQVAKVTSIPTTVEFEAIYSEKTIANVAYDLFTSPTLDADVEYELMVWPAAMGGALPLSSSGKPIKTVKIGNVDFTLYQGMNGNMTVLSYVAAKTVNNFKVDLKKFFDELPANYSIAPTQYLRNVQFGTEALIGHGTLTMSKYSAAVHTA